MSENVTIGIILGSSRQPRLGDRVCTLGKPASILSYSDTPHGGNIAGHELRMILNKLGMFPMPKSLPLAYADRLLDGNGRLAETALTEDGAWAAKVSAFIPRSLTELVRYAVLLRQARLAAA